MKPFAYVFVVVLTRMRISKCALAYEEGADEATAFSRFTAKLSSDKLVYASVPIFDKNSLSWDRFVSFIKSNDGEIVDGLRFREYDAEWICMQFADDIGVWPQTYLSRYAAVASIQKQGVEYAGVFNWYDEDMDSACTRITKTLPINMYSQLCAIFEGAADGACEEIMRWYEALPSVSVGRFKFVKIAAQRLIQDLDSAIMMYQGQGYVDVERQYFVSCDDQMP